MTPEFEAGMTEPAIFNLYSATHVLKLHKHPTKWPLASDNHSFNLQADNLESEIWNRYLEVKI